MTQPQPQPRAMASGQPTLRDVAACAGVSPMTASRALRDDEGVSAATRKRVLEAAASLGYRRNEAARNLRLGRSDGLIGLIVTNLANPSYSQLALGLEAAVAEQGMRVVLGNSGEDPAREQQLVHDFVSRRLDGLVVVPASHNHAHLGPDQTRDIPIVLAASPPVKVDVDAVLLDDFGGTWEATRHLIAAGHRRIGFLGLPAATWTGSERTAATAPRWTRPASRSTTSSPRTGSGTSALPRRPPSRFSTCPRHRRRSSPRTTGTPSARTGPSLPAARPPALAGFDDFELADALGIPLTVVAYDPRQLGREAARLLCERLGNTGSQPGAPRRVIVPTRVIEYN